MMVLNNIKNRSGNTETIIVDFGFIIKETATEVILVFPDGVVKITK